MAVLSVIGTVIAKVAPGLIKANAKKWAKDELKMFGRIEKDALKHIEKCVKKYAKDKDKRGFKQLKKSLGDFIHLTMVGWDVTKVGKALEAALSKASPEDRAAMEAEIKKAFKAVFEKQGTVNSPVVFKTTNMSIAPSNNTGIAPPIITSTGVNILATATNVQQKMAEQAKAEGKVGLTEALGMLKKTGAITVPPSGGIAGGLSAAEEIAKQKGLTTSTQMEKIKEFLTKAFTWAKTNWYISVPVLLIVGYLLYKKFIKK